ncbi:HNH endonuclease [Tardiphaga sp.]|uniref:HNH endonuclease n=1 Tax=Tardiphaga sp. TaxID=1926292 RepID=UPI0037D9FCF4
MIQAPDCRVFMAHEGVCHLAGRKIKPGEPWDCDHVIALINGGEHRESNLAPALRDKHREKTAEDVAEKSRVYRKAAKNIGIDLRSSPKIRSVGFRPAGAQHRASAPINKWRGYAP